MPRVILDEEALIGQRLNEIRDFLSPLTAPTGIACNFAPLLVGRGRVLAAHDGQISGKEYRDWRFRSFYRNIFCQYFEIWQPEVKRKWYLDRAYLQMFLLNRTSREERELLCVHSDPNNNDASPIREFKLGPHLHVKHLEEPLRHSHFPLTTGYVERSVESAGELTRVFREVILLLSQDVVNRFKLHDP